MKDFLGVIYHIHSWNLSYLDRRYNISVSSWTSQVLFKSQLDIFVETRFVDLRFSISNLFINILYSTFFIINCFRYCSIKLFLMCKYFLDIFELIRSFYKSLNFFFVIYNNFFFFLFILSDDTFKGMNSKIANVR